MAIVTISRGSFSGGKAVAEALAERLGYLCVSREDLIQNAARDFEISTNDFNAVMEEQPSFWQKASAQRMAYLNILKSVLLKKVQDSRVVYHGHAIQFLLGNIKGVLRVRINADMEYRINSAMRHHGCNRDQAIAMIADLDKQSIKWTRYLYGVEWNDPSLFDVVFNLERFNVQSVVEMLYQMTKLDEFVPDDSSRRSFENRRLESMVWAALAKDKRTRAASVQVEADNGQITIGGSVGSKHVLDDVLAVAKQISGVRAVTIHIGIGSNWLW